MVTFMVVLMTLKQYDDNEVIHDHNNNSGTQEYAGIRSSYKLFILHIMLKVRYSFYRKKKARDANYQNYYI